MRHAARKTGREAPKRRQIDAASRWNDLQRLMRQVLVVLQMEYTMTRTKIEFVNNHDTGSLPVPSQLLPQQFRQNALRPSPGVLQVSINGSAPADVTYVMGSDAKGWNLCMKGAGKVPEEGVAELTYAE